MKRAKWIAALCLALSFLTVGTTFARYMTTLNDSFRLNIIAEIYNLTLYADHGAFSDNTEVKKLKQASNRNFGVHNDLTRNETVDGEDMPANTYTFLGWAYQKHPDKLTVDFQAAEEIIVTARDTILYAVWLREGPLTDSLLDDIGYEAGVTTDLVIPGYVQSPDGDTWYEITELPTGIFGHIYAEDTTVTSVVIPDTVTSIGYGVFGRFSAMETVVISDSVTEIGERAFHFCTSLQELNLPANLKTIGNHAFVNCSALTNVVIPDGVTYVGDYSFSQCHALETLVIPSSVTYVGRGATYQGGQDVGGIKIIYDGTMEQWNTICTDDIGAGNSAYLIQCTDGNIVGKNYAGSYDLPTDEEEKPAPITLNPFGINMDTFADVYPADTSMQQPVAGKDFGYVFEVAEGYTLPEYITVEIDGTSYQVYTDGLEHRQVPEDGSELPPMPTFDPDRCLLTIPAILLTGETKTVRIEAVAVAVESETPDPLTCTCEVRCTDLNDGCAVCSTGITACGGTEPQPPADDPVEEGAPPANTETPGVTETPSPAGTEPPEPENAEVPGTPESAATPSEEALPPESSPPDNTDPEGDCE